MATSHLVCCEREDNSKYWHAGCGCPYAVNVGTVTKLNKTMCGHNDPESAESPPKYYLEKRIISAVNQYVDGPRVYTFTYAVDGTDCVSSSEYTKNPTCPGWGIGGTWYSEQERTWNNTYYGILPIYNDEGGKYWSGLGPTCFTDDGTSCKETLAKSGDCLTDSRTLEYTPPSVILTYTGSCDIDCEPSQVGKSLTPTSWGLTGETSTLSNPRWSGTANSTATYDRSCFDPPGTISTLSNTNTVTVEFSSTSAWQGVAGKEIDNGTDSATGLPWEDGTFYANEYTEDQAITDASSDPYESPSSKTHGTGYDIQSLPTVRSQNNMASQTSSVYSILLTQLVVGATYTVTPKIKKETYSWDSGSGSLQYSAPTYQDLPTEEFVATGIFHILGGSLNVPEEDFIDNSYSTHGPTYGQSAQFDVISPTKVLSEVAGTRVTLEPPVIHKKG